MRRKLIINYPKTFKCEIFDDYEEIDYESFFFAGGEPHVKIDKNLAFEGNNRNELVFEDGIVYNIQTPKEIRNNLRK